MAEAGYLTKETVSKSALPLVFSSDCTDPSTQPCSLSAHSHHTHHIILSMSVYLPHKLPKGKVHDILISMCYIRGLTQHRNSVFTD